MDENPVIIQIKEQIRWVAWRDLQSDNWIGSTDDLKLTACGECWVDLEAMISEIHEQLFADLREDGGLDEYLKIHKLTLDKPIPPLSTPVKFDVVFSIDVVRRQTAIPH